LIAEAFKQWLLRRDHRPLESFVEIKLAE